MQPEDTPLAVASGDAPSTVVQRQLTWIDVPAARTRRSGSHPDNASGARLVNAYKKAVLKSRLQLKEGDACQYNTFEFGWRSGAAITQVHDDGTFNILLTTGSSMGMDLERWRPENLRPDPPPVRAGSRPPTIEAEAPPEPGMHASTADLYAALSDQERLLQRRRRELAGVAASVRKHTSAKRRGEAESGMFQPPMRDMMKCTASLFPCRRLPSAHARNTMSTADVLHALAGRHPPRLPAAGLAVPVAAVCAAAAVASIPAVRPHSSDDAEAAEALADALATPLPSSPIARHTLATGEAQRNSSRSAAGRMRIAPPTIIISRTPAAQARALAAAEAAAAAAEAAEAQGTVAEAVRRATVPTIDARASPRRGSVRRRRISGTPTTPVGEVRPGELSRPSSAASTRPGAAGVKVAGAAAAAPSPQHAKPDWVTVQVAGFSHARPNRRPDRPQSAKGLRQEPGLLPESIPSQKRPASAPSGGRPNDGHKVSDAPETPPPLATTGLAERVHNTNPPPGAGVDSALRALALETPRADAEPSPPPCNLMLLLQFLTEQKDSGREPELDDDSEEPKRPLPSLRSMWSTMAWRRKSRRRSSRRRSTKHAAAELGAGLSAAGARAGRRLSPLKLKCGMLRRGPVSHKPVSRKSSFTFACVAGQAGGRKPGLAGGFYSSLLMTAVPKKPGAPDKRVAGGKVQTKAVFGASGARPLRARAPLSPTLRLQSPVESPVHGRSNTASSPKRVSSWARLITSSPQPSPRAASPPHPPRGLTWAGGLPA